MEIIFENIIDVDKELIEQIRQWRNSKKVNQYMFTNHHILKEEHIKWINKLKKTNTAKSWVIKYEDKPICIVSLSNTDYQNKVTDWGFYIADEKMRGRGIGSAVLKKLMEIVFDEMNFNEMKTMALENNTVAINLYTKLGFKKTAILDEKLVRNGKSVEVFIMTAEKKEWGKQGK